MASLIEYGEDDRIVSYLREHLPRNTDFEVVVLGCTHYPLIKKEISNVLGEVIFYDGGAGVARRLYHLLVEKSLISDASIGKVQFYDSSDNEAKANRFYDILEK